MIVSGVLVARMLGVENRGHLALLTVLPLILAVFGGLGLPLATTFEVAREPSIARPLLRSLAGFIGAQTLVLTLLHGVLLVLLVGRRDYDVKMAALFSVAAVPAFVALQLGLAVLQGQQRYRVLNVLRSTPAVLYAGLALTLFFVGSGTLPVLTAGFVMCWLIVGILTLVLAIRGSQPAAASQGIPPRSQLIKFGVRSVLGSASPTDGAGIDQAVVGLFLSARALGLYVVAAAFMNLSRLVAQSIGLVAYPNVAGRQDPADATRAMWRFTALGVLAGLLITVVLELTIGHLIVLLFGESFRDAAGVAQILLVAAFFFGARRVLSEAARGANRPLIGTIAEVASWAVLAPALIVLTPLLGLDGVASAIAVSSAVGLAVIVRGVRRPPRPRPGTPLRTMPGADSALEARDAG